MRKIIEYTLVPHFALPLVRLEEALQDGRELPFVGNSGGRTQGAAAQ